MTHKVISVAVSGVTYTIDHTYDYLLPPTLLDDVCEGTRVVVPFGRGNKRVEAMVLAVSEMEEKPVRLKQVAQVLDEQPIVSGETLRLVLWLRERCFCTFYDALRAVLPAGIFYSMSVKYSLAELYADNLEAALSAVANDMEKQIVELCCKTHNLDTIKEKIGAGAEKTLKKLVKQGLINEEDDIQRGVGDKVITLYSIAESSEAIDEYIKRYGKRAPAAKDVLEYVTQAVEAAAEEICYFTGRGRGVITGLVSSGKLKKRAVEVFRRPMPPATLRQEQVTLSPEQRQAAERLCKISDEGEPRAALLFGVTGSGKTQVYLELCRHILDRGEGVMVLVPEIALTPQLMQIFSSRFGDRVAILHSALSVGQRSDEWKRINMGHADVVLGTRSAVFAPVKNLGAIIIDEEQEQSYKSDSTPRYHARDVARYRISRSGGLLLLGSATPSVESYYRAEESRYELLELAERFNLRALPQVIIADMRRELADGNPLSVSRTLKNEIEQNLEAGEQSILFLNRRGNSRQLICGQCGYVPGCKRCSVSYTYHSANSRLMCHFCGSSEKLESHCPECGGLYKFSGSGTQKCETDLKELFPGIRVLRMDSDTTSARHSHEQILAQFREKKADLLLGTQMVAKGLDFENVTLVGVVDADQSLYADDFRAHERAFSLITQVVGRAGRGSKTGRAVVQTFAPENPVILAASKQDYRSFYSSEIELRRRLNYPPFSDIITVTVSCLDEGVSFHAGLFVKQCIESALASCGADGTVLGPAQAAVFKVKERYRYKVSLICRDTRNVRRAVQAVVRMFRENKQFQNCLIYADLNPNETN